MCTAWASWAVFRFEGGRAAQRTMGVGHRGSLESEILSGLEGGDLVVAHPGEGIEDGGRVQPAE